jgi:hypothetical protein
VHRIDDIVRQVRDVYRVRTDADGPDMWDYVARDYIAAATVIEESEPQRLLPRLWLTGHAVETALKAYLCARGLEWHGTNGHDLIGLLKLADQAGVEVADRDVAAIAHLHHIYYEELVAAEAGNERRFYARYPRGSFGVSTPANAEYVAIVESRLIQAKLPKETPPKRGS